MIDSLFQPIENTERGDNGIMKYVNPSLSDLFLINFNNSWDILLKMLKCLLHV